ncbi:spore germination protein [Paenibacillus sp. Soil787]
MLSILLPSLYVAATTFHSQLIPTQLLLSIASVREGIPFPAAIEAI